MIHPRRLPDRLGGRYVEGAGWVGDRSSSPITPPGRPQRPRRATGRPPPPSEASSAMAESRRVRLSPAPARPAPPRHGFRPLAPNLAVAAREPGAGEGRGEEAREDGDGVELDQGLLAPARREDHRRGEAEDDEDPPMGDQEPVLAARSARAAGLRRRDPARRGLEHARAGEVGGGCGREQQQGAEHLEEAQAAPSPRMSARDIGKQGRVLARQPDAETDRERGERQRQRADDRRPSARGSTAPNRRRPRSPSWGSWAIALEGASTPVASAIPSGNASRTAASDAFAERRGARRRDAAAGCAARPAPRRRSRRAPSG